ncbi:30S ribosomal protein S2 [Candidatus Roizmanbacteria bacterium RIFCSPHIGHO2_01_FULL_39_12b]|uniref:Small ribosomal subunit protein uS2 n=1 Tax=Candidatus Roizmanbacteria bacterium RIFCSPHIGHO2_01_FULL_39_12b TaxID=1802030 RepID=A0A1F7G881_9BACT|nr:MAG: 30S ribosomal protein S2 [Candidatus Roizmanbacteria bacterium RIFCSPHIGHO2_01_FULL_39_12b]
MNKISPEELLKAGVHLGHRKQKINPASKKFIYKIESGVSIIDLFQTAPQLDKALEFIRSLGKEGKIITFVATKKGARDIVEEIAKKNNLTYITNKWVGGFLTNFSEVHKNVELLNTLTGEKERGEWNKYVKHERVTLEKKMRRITSIYEGVLTLDKIPDALFIIDIKKEKNAVTEAKRCEIRTVALVDTNSDPGLVDYPIIGNDDALTSVQFIVENIVGAYLEGLALHKIENDKASKIAQKKAEKEKKISSNV